MRRNLISFIVVVGTVGLAAWGRESNGHARPGIIASLHAAQSEDQCTLATLSGRYLATGAEERPNAPDFPRRSAGVWVFDGEGNITWVETVSRGGEILHNQGTGTYTLDSDCTGTLTVGPPTTSDIFASSDGRVVNLIRTNEGTIATRSFRRDSEKSTATLGRNAK